MDRMLGNRFAPTEYELVTHYLMKQNLGDTSEIHNPINVVRICDYKPEFLPSLSKLKSDNHTWYYFHPKEFRNKMQTSRKMTTCRKRSTPTGFWKVTGKERKIKDVKGVEIGTKKSLVYHYGKVRDSVSTDWVMHEYDTTASLPADKSNFVLCKLMYKGKDFIPLAGDNSSLPNHNLVFDSNNSNMTPATITGPQVQQPLQEEIFRGCYVNNHFTMPMNQHVDHSSRTIFNDKNNRHGVQLDDTNVVNASRDGFSLFRDNNNRPAIRRRTEVEHEQAVPKENIHGFYANDLAMVVNQHLDLPLSYVLHANTSFSNNNNNNNSHGVQLEPPTGIELIHHNLHKQIKGESETSTIHNVISVVNMCDHEPKFLPSLSKLKSDDQTWYYLSPKEYTSERMTSRKRTTETGFWKVTGKHRKIKRGDSVQVGNKKTLVYYQGRGSNAVQTHWVMHEHEITSLPIDQNIFLSSGELSKKRKTQRISEILEEKAAEGQQGKDALDDKAAGKEGDAEVREEKSSEYRVSFKHIGKVPLVNDASACAELQRKMNSSPNELPEVTGLEYPELFKNMARWNVKSWGHQNEVISRYDRTVKELKVKLQEQEKLRALAEAELDVEKGKADGLAGKLAKCQAELKKLSSDRKRVVEELKKYKTSSDQLIQAERERSRVVDEGHRFMTDQVKVYLKGRAKAHPAMLKLNQTEGKLNCLQTLFNKYQVELPSDFVDEVRQDHADHSEEVWKAGAKALEEIVDGLRVALLDESDLLEEDGSGLATDSMNSLCES